MICITDGAQNAGAVCPIDTNGLVPFRIDQLLSVLCMFTLLCVFIRDLTYFQTLPSQNEVSVDNKHKVQIMFKLKCQVSKCFQWQHTSTGFLRYMISIQPNNGHYMCRVSLSKNVIFIWRYFKYTQVVFYQHFNTGNIFTDCKMYFLA